MILVIVLIALLFAAPASATDGWHVRSQQIEDGARMTVTATPAAARRTAGVCTTRGLKACLKPLRVSFLYADCRDQGVTGKRMGRMLRTAAALGPVVFVSETGGYPWRCVPVHP